MMKNNTLAFHIWWLIVISFSTIGYLAYDYGAFHEIYTNDTTKLSVLIFVVFIISTIITGYRTWLFSFRDTYTDTSLGWFVSSKFIVMGFIGTLVGIAMMFKDSWTKLVSDDITNELIKSVIVDMTSGISVVIYTTLVGIVSYLILNIQLMNLDYATDHYTSN